MTKILLINMPFANVRFPSIGLTQLKSMLEDSFGDAISVDILYLNQDFAKYIGLSVYQPIANAVPPHHSTGVGDWFFRNIAFPYVPDNADEYFRRYYSFNQGRTAEFRKTICEKRAGLHVFMQQLIDKYQLDQVDVVGFSSMFSQNVACFAMAQLLKECKPSLITIMGGANCEAPMGPEIVKNVEQIDFVFSGPALKSFPQFISCYLQQRLDECDQIKGVFSKRNCPQREIVTQAGKLEYSQSVGDELNINVPVRLDYDSFLTALETTFPNTTVKPALQFETSRGCWWGERSHCTFCGLNGATINYRSMNAPAAVTYINSLFRYADRCNYFESVDNIMSRNYIKEVLPNLQTPPNATIFYEVRADLSADDLKQMAAAGIKDIQPGIEALNTSVLKLMGKGTSAFQNLRFLKDCALYGLRPSWNLLVGFPSEDAKVYAKYITDLPLFTHLYPPGGIFPIRFDRYSPYFTKATQYGLDLQPQTFYKYVYPFPEEALANLAYFFKDQTSSPEYATTMNRWFHRLQEKFKIWNQLWFAKNENAVLPELYIKSEADITFIYDSRTGTAVEYELSAISAALLNQLSLPKKLKDLKLNFGYLPDLNIEKEIKWLQERGLLFEEDDRFMSLVLATKSSLAENLI